MAELTKQDKDALRVLDDAWTKAEKHQSPRNDIFLRLYQQYKAYDPDIQDPYRSQIFFPKIYSTIENIVPRLGKALFSVRPHIPITSTYYQEQADYIEQALDEYLTRDGFRFKGIEMLKHVALFGTGFLEPIPVMQEVMEKNIVPSPVFPFTPQVVSTKKKRFALRTKILAPWQVFPQPGMQSFDGAGWVIKIEYVHKADVVKLQETGRYKAGKLEELPTGDGSDEAKVFSNKILQSVGITTPSKDNEMGVLIRYESPERYITSWNGTFNLEDRDNPYNHKRINLARFIYNTDPVNANSFWGQGDAKCIESLCDALNTQWRTTFDNHDLINQGAFISNPNAVNADNIVMVGGVRIETHPDFNGNLQNEALKRIETPGLPRDAYNIPAILEDFIDETTSQFEVNRGEVSDSDTTATEISAVTASGNLKMELKVALLESTGMREFAKLATSHMDQFASMEDLVDTIGPDAINIVTLDPESIPGAIDYSFRGSDTILNDFQARADLREFGALLQNSQYLRPGGLENMMAERFGFSKSERERLVLSEEEIAMVQQQNAMLQAIQIAGGGGTSTGGKAVNGTQTPTIQNPTGGSNAGR